MIALLVETETNEGKAQSLIAPLKNEVVCYHRLSNGSRGRGQAWKQTCLDELPLDMVTCMPVAVPLTYKDIEGLAVGQITTLAVKAMTAFEQTSPVEPVDSHRAVVADLTLRLIAGDMTLNAYVKDGRRNSPVVLTPLAKPVEPMEVSEGAHKQQEAPVLVGASPVIMELATIPTLDWSKKYINRKINGLIEYAIYDNAMTNNENILIMGHAGSGKTMSVLGYASTRGYRYYNVSSHIGLEPTQLFGSWIPTPDGHFRWQDGPVTDLVRNGGVLLLNEVNFMPSVSPQFCSAYLTTAVKYKSWKNGGEVIKAHKDLLIIADMNPNYRGTRPMNQAWVDRFHHKLDFPYDHSIESKLIKNKALLEMANKLRELSNKGDLDTPISTRGLANFIKNATNLNLDYAMSSYVNGFLDEEREAVKLVLDTYKPNIGVELGITVEVAPTQVDEVAVNG
jgi:nitric oxide reductase NorQ protein